MVLPVGWEALLMDWEVLPVDPETLPEGWGWLGGLPSEMQEVERPCRRAGSGRLILPVGR